MWGKTFSNPLGVAAGFDKDAEIADAVLGLGFGFMEVGAVLFEPMTDLRFMIGLSFSVLVAEIIRTAAHDVPFLYWFCVLRLAPSCRAKDAINEHLGTNNVTTMQLDVAQFDTIRKFVDEFLAKEEPLHILINNAGVHLPGGWSDSPEESGQRTPEGFEVCAACNVPTWNLVVVQAAVLQSQSSAASSTAVPGCSVLCGRPATLPSPSSSSYLKLTSAAAMCR